MKHLFILIVIFSSVGSLAAEKKKSLKRDFESLGDNKVFAERVKNMETDRKVRIVQNRIVDLNNRLEIGASYAFTGGGDSYVNTENVGAQVDFHINPHFAIGLRYQKSYNELTSEGKSQYQRAHEAQAVDPASTERFVGIDYPLQTTLATFSYAPIYGKLNLFDVSVAHFDIYTMVGYGKMKLLSGETDLVTGGVGMSVWLSQHFSTRFEARYQTYEDLVGTEDSRRQHGVQGMASLGILL